MTSTIISWILAVVVFVIGILYLVFVHPVPALVSIIVSLIILPPVNAALKNKVGFAVPFAVRLGLGLFLIWFTLGVSDLGDMID